MAKAKKTTEAGIITVTGRITNNASLSKNGTQIDPKTEKFEGSNIQQAMGFALKWANEVLAPGQYDAPEFSVFLPTGEELILSKAMVNKIKKPFWEFRLEFPIIRETLMAQHASLNLEDAASRLAYVKATDVNGYYTKSKQVSVEQASAQITERLRVVKDITKWAKEDAKSSVVPKEVQQLRQLKAEEAKQKRIAAKASEGK